MILLDPARNPLNCYENFGRELGRRIARLRKKQEMTQEQLAEQLGVKQYTVARFEAGLSRVPVALLPELGRILSVNANDLLGISSEKSKPGPAPFLQKQLEQIRALPREKQT